jgi:hypothetical protein
VIKLLRVLDSLLTERSVVIADGGDFVASASYVLRPRGPWGWMDTGRTELTLRRRPAMY